MQAARGASLSSSSRDANPTGIELRHRRALGLLAAVFTAVYVVDQVTKWWAVDRLDYGSAHRLIGGLLQVHLTRNPGAAFSTGTAYTAVLSLVAVTAVVVVMWFSRRVQDRWWAAAFGLLLAGVGGNLTDRVFRAPGPLRGHVVDFLELPHWPIFNVADVSINLAAALILVQAFRGVRLDGSRPAHTGSGTPEE